jgi:Arc/MetJ family transcription regulator
MPRTTVNVEETALEEARRALGTEGLSETINAALREVARRSRLAAFDVRSFDITDADIESARRNRLE